MRLAEIESARLRAEARDAPLGRHSARLSGAVIPNDSPWHTTQAPAPERTRSQSSVPARTRTRAAKYPGWRRSTSCSATVVTTARPITVSARARGGRSAEAASSAPAAAAVTPRPGHPTRRVSSARVFDPSREAYANGAGSDSPAGVTLLLRRCVGVGDALLGHPPIDVRRDFGVIEREGRE